MKPGHLRPASRHVSFGELSGFIRAQLEKHPTLRCITRADYNHLVSLERAIFPNTSAIFDTTCIRHAMDYYNLSILIGKHESRIESYFSFFPLTQSGFEYCIENETTSICHFPSQLFKPRRHRIRSIFLEVLATTSDCPYATRVDTIAIAVSLLRHFRYLPFLSCPVSDEGLRILRKFDFEPIREPGLNRLYQRLPEQADLS